MFENIERIKAPPRDVFIRDYVLKQKPVIITDLFQGQPITRMDNVEVVRRELGDTPVLFHEGHDQREWNVLEAAMDGRYGDVSWAASEQGTLRDFIDYLAAHPETMRIISEVPASMTPQLNAMYEIPSYCRTGSGAVDPDFSGELWLGRRGNRSLLHYDRDAKNLFQYQLFGEKHVILVPPKSSRKLIPIRNNCLLSPVNVSDDERDRFVRWVDGYQAVVRTGETLFMPALIWHYFDYNQQSMALTMRFLRNEANRFLADSCHTDYHLQSLQWRLMDWENTEERFRAAFREIQQALARPANSPMEKAERLQKLFEELYVRECPDDLQGEFYRQAVELLRQRVRRLEVEQAGFYSLQAAA